MLKFYCLVTGDEYQNIKNETAESKKKIRLYAISVVIPVIMWAVTSYLLANQVLKYNAIISLLVMVICSSIIFVIEKAILMTNGNKVIGRFRIILGIVIALIGATAFDEVIFKNDIDTQMAENKEVFISQGLSKKKMSLIDEINRIELEVNGKYTEWKIAYDEAAKEYDGSGGSGIKGNGFRTSIKMQRANEMKAEYEKMSGKLEMAKSSMDSTLAATGSNLEKSYNENSILLRIEAMIDLVSKSTAILIAYILFTMLIALLELMVIILKKYSKETTYERKVRLVEEIGRKRMDNVLNENLTNFDRNVFKNEVEDGTIAVNRRLNGVLN